jgi:hypothetical protein
MIVLERPLPLLMMIVLPLFDITRPCASANENVHGDLSYRQLDKYNNVNTRRDIIRPCADSKHEKNRSQISRVAASSRASRFRFDRRAYEFATSVLDDAMMR